MSVALALVRLRWCASMPAVVGVDASLAEFAAAAIQACRRGQLARRTTAALLHARAEREAALGAAAATEAARRSASSRPARRSNSRGAASAQMHVRRQSAAAIRDRQQRQVSVRQARHDARREDQPAQPPDGDAAAAAAPTAATEGDLVVTCAELREWALHCPALDGLGQLLAECERSQRARRDRERGAAAEDEALASAAAELEDWCRCCPANADLAALARECAAEADRREAAARPAAQGDLLATTMQAHDMLESVHRGPAQQRRQDALGALRDECDRELARRGPPAEQTHQAQPSSPHRSSAAARQRLYNVDELQRKREHQKQLNQRHTTSSPPVKKLDAETEGRLYNQAQISLRAQRVRQRDAANPAPGLRSQQPLQGEALDRLYSRAVESRLERRERSNFRKWASMHALHYNDVAMMEDRGFSTLEHIASSSADDLLAVVRSSSSVDLLEALSSLRPELTMKHRRAESPDSEDDEDQRYEDEDDGNHSM